MKSNVCIKTASVFIMLFAFTFSLSAFASMGDLINCTDFNDQETYNDTIDYLKKNPEDVVMIYGLGINALCIGKTEEGISHIKNASNGGHIMASRIMALYHRTDGTWDSSAELTNDSYHFNQMLGYYERAALLIESAPHYPEGTTRDMLYLEEHVRISAKVFVSLPDIYYKGYVAAIVDIMSDEEAYIDTRDVLVAMQDSAGRCLRRPSLSVWNGQRGAIAHALQVRCQAMWDFADKAITLEEKRIDIAERDCSSSHLSQCSEHHNIVNQIVSLSYVMQEQMDSVPVIH